MLAAWEEGCKGHLVSLACLTIAQECPSSQHVSLQIHMTVAAGIPDGRAEKGRTVAEKSSWPQQPVISIRISEVLRSRLERLKEVLSKKSGESVSTSEVAKQLLESAREDRLEVAELLNDATVALAAARREAEAGLSLYRAEWIVLAYHVQWGVASHIGGPISPETMSGILGAFLAAFAVRRGKKSSRDANYPRICPSWTSRASRFSEPMRRASMFRPPWSG